MGILTDDMKRVVKEQKLGFIATVCPDGTPNLSPKGTTEVWDDDHLMFVDICSPGTMANLRQNPAIEINVVDQLVRKGYRFKGTAEVLDTGPVFEQGPGVAPRAGRSEPDASGCAGDHHARAATHLAGLQPGAERRRDARHIPSLLRDALERARGRGREAGVVSITNPALEDTMSLVTYEVDGRVGVVTLNRPDKLNAISPELKKTLVERFHEADRDPTTSVVILRAEGRSFSAGYDISPNPARAARRGNALAWHTSLSDDAALELTPWTMKKPVIASVQGHCLGGGCELAMLCDLTIAADDALFGEPEIRFSNVGPVMVMPWVIGLKRARELLYLGDPIDAPTALAFGMVNRVVPSAGLVAATLKLARRMALISPEALAATKLAVNRGAECAGFLNAMHAGVDVLAALYAARTEVGVKFDEIREKEGLGAALRWRAAQFAE
jgi:enoyl-CoA hydratase